MTPTTRRLAAASCTGWTTSVPCRSTRPTRRSQASCSPGPGPATTTASWSGPTRWAADGVPVAWSFPHLHIVPKPTGFPPSADDLEELGRLAGEVASAFRSRLVAADFARGTDGHWWFIEAGPGSCAGTGHEAVFKAVARRLRGEEPELRGDAVGGPL